MNSELTLASVGAAERTKAAALHSLHSHSTAAFSANSVGADKSISIISFFLWISSC